MQFWLRARQHRFQTGTFQAEVKRSRFNNLASGTVEREKNDFCYENGTFGSYVPRMPGVA